MKFSEGQRIRYTAESLGCINSDHVVKSGDIGIYQGPAPIFPGDGDDRWHITVVTVPVEGGTAMYACPALESMFEPADA